MVADSQTLKDLEFTTIREWLAENTIGQTAKDKCLNLTPDSNPKRVEYQLNTTFELYKIKDEGESFPDIQFEELHNEIRLLPVDKATLQLEGFMRIHKASTICNALLVFFDKREKDYPLLHELVNTVYHTTEIIEAIEKVFDKFGKIKDEASAELYELRSRIKIVQKEINKNFDKEVRKLSRNNLLGDTTETFIDDRRVLTVLSSHKRKVPGIIVGTSNTGNLTYIEPEVNIELNREIEALHMEEQREIERILQALRNELSIHLELIKGYQRLLTIMDFINAKARMAFHLNCQLPSIESETRMELIDAFHPILWKTNKDHQKNTVPQNLYLDKFGRMLVISGPNAGGKSITLKTVGLLQLMLQSGLMVPVNANSSMCIFQQICSDIGDNQSIENELSTYSYRLKRMKNFLDIANKKTLFLLDEFGTGSDPDLGGALAEAIFESLYNKKSFGVITTHYANIKLKADKLKNAFNGSMLFNTDTLEPTFMFNPGQPGSSFTFEVAKINGIPEEIIDAAKMKLDEQKVKMDQLLSDLQKEKNYYDRLKAEYLEAQEEASDAIEQSKESKAYYDKKIEQFKTNAEQNNKYIQLGKRLSGYIDQYNSHSRKKTINDGLLDEIRKFLAVEKSKIIEVQQKKKEAKKKPQQIRKYKPKHDEYHRDRIKLGSRVKMITTKQVGTVEEIDKETVTVAFGFARMKVDISKLMWVN